MPENILFEGEFNPADFVKGIDTMLDKGRQLAAQEKELQVTLDNTSLALKQKDEKIKAQQILLDNLRASNTRLKESYEGVGKAAENLQKTVGKPLAVSLNANQAITNIQKLTASIETLRAKMLVKQELLIKETDLNKIAKYNKEIAALGAQMTKTANAGRKGFDDVGNALKPQEGILQRLTRQAQLYAKAVHEATLPENITKYNQKLEATNLQIKNLSNSGKAGFDGMGKAAEASATRSGNAFTKSFGLIRTLANILPGIGISGIFLLLFEGFEKLVGKIELFKDAEKDMNDVIAETGKIAGATVGKIDIYKQKLNDTNLSSSERIKVAKEYNKVADEAFQIDLKQINNLGLINDLLKSQFTLLQKRALATAFESKIAEKQSAVLAADFKLKLGPEGREIAQLEREAKDEAITGLGRVGKTARLPTQKEIDAYNNSPEGIADAAKAKAAYARNERIKFLKQQQKLNNEDAFKALSDAQKELNDLLSIADFYIDPEGLVTKDPKGKKEKTPKQAPENVYRQKLLELRAKLEAINESVFTSESTIRAKIEAEVAKGNDEYDRLFKDKKLTSPEVKSLKALNSTVGQAEIAKELKAFNEKRKAAQKQIDDELERLRADDVEKRIANIKGEFEQESAAISLEYEKQRKALEKSKADELEKITTDNKTGLISDQQLFEATADLENAYSKLFADLDAYITRKQAELSQKSFDRSVQGIKDVFAGTFTIQSEATTEKINALTQTYLKGEIDFKKYQKELTKTLREETKERLKMELLELQSQLASVNSRLDNPEAGDTPEFKKKLKAQQLALRGQISTNKRNTATGNAGDEDAEDNAKLQKLNDYVQAYINIVNPILQFWQAANEAEAKSLDRSIAIQQRRVDAAQRIADRGNATYLKSEEDKMNDLRVKQEANARRQIAINAAIQASSALTAVVSGVAKAVITGNPLDAIAAVGAVIAAIGAGFQLVKTLQQNQIGFYEGTEDTGPGGKVDNKRGFHAVLHPNERVMTAEQNKKLKGISNEELVQVVEKSKVLVEQYRTPDLPAVDYDRLEHAAHFHITHDGRLAAMMEENTSKLTEVNANVLRLNKTMKSMGVSMSMDRNGFLAIALDGFKQDQINKKV